MWLSDVLFVFVIALVLSLLFIPWRGPERGRVAGTATTAALFFFLIFFFATWAGGLWLRPMGPPVWGAYWLPFVMIGLFLALLMAATAAPSRRFYDREPVPSRREEVESAHAGAAAAGATFGLVFWILLAFLIAAVVTAYVWDWL